MQLQKITFHSTINELHNQKKHTKQTKTQNCKQTQEGRRNAPANEESPI